MFNFILLQEQLDDENRSSMAKKKNYTSGSSVNDLWPLARPGGWRKPKDMLYWAEMIDKTFIYGYNQLLSFDSTALLFSVQNEWNFLCFHLFPPIMNNMCMNSFYNYSNYYFLLCFIFCLLFQANICLN